MQALAYEKRDQRFLLIKAPPASGKSRALMYIALDKLEHQGVKKVVVAVPEKGTGLRLGIFAVDAADNILEGMLVCVLGTEWTKTFGDMIEE
jgi:Rad3-related DNA helicase